MAVKLFFVITCFSFLINSSRGIMFNLEPGITKCLKEESHKNRLVVGIFTISPVPQQTADVTVTDSKGQLLAKRQNVYKGRFVFSTDEDEEFQTCFNSSTVKGYDVILESSTLASHEVTYDTKTGYDAERNQSMTTEEHHQMLKPLERQLRDLEVLVNHLLIDTENTKTRREALTVANELTSSRFTYFSLFIAVCLLFLAFWQILYLYRYFQSKQLVD